MLVQEWRGRRRRGGVGEVDGEVPQEPALRGAGRGRERRAGWGAAARGGVPQVPLLRPAAQGAEGGQLWRDHDLGQVHRQQDRIQHRRQGLGVMLLWRLCLIYLFHYIRSLYIYIYIYMHQ